jgi:chromosomal replication initiation ATPase DnaA
MNSRGKANGVEAQLKLPLDHAESFRRERFVVSDGNRDAVAGLDAWPDWPGGALALIGPSGSGKTHLARVWADRSGALILARGALDVSAIPTGPVLIEDADGLSSDTALFHLLNRAEAGASLLLTSRQTPRSWPVSLPDLRSRLNAILAFDLPPPDDVVLAGVLLNFFRDRHIKPDGELLAYLLRRMERSAPAALALVTRLDEAASAARREVTRALAREVLEEAHDQGELFA